MIALKVVTEHEELKYWSDGVLDCRAQVVPFVDS
jgi:hypothetical protein